MNTHLHIVPSGDDHDYELRLTIDYHLSAPGAETATCGRYVLSGERRDDEWWQTVVHVLVADTRYGDHVVAEPELVTDQTHGPDLRTLLEALLHGPLADDGSNAVLDLTENEFVAVQAAPPELRDELVRLLTQAPDSFGRWLGRMALSASPWDFDRTGVPEPYTDLARRLRGAGLAAAAMRKRAESLARDAEMLERAAERTA